MANEETRPTRGDEVEEFGYQQHFQRTLHSFTSFAIAFSFISITTGIFTTYSFLLTTSGPVGIWTWIVVMFGQLLVSLVFAQLAAHIPLSGYSYQWASRLTNAYVGWGFGWLSYAFLAIVVVSVDYGLATQAVVPLFKLSTSTSTAQLVTIIVLAVQAAFIIFSTRIVAAINAAAVATEVIGILALTVALIVVVIVGSKGGSLSNLGSSGVVSSGSGSGYLKFNGPFMLALLLGSYTIVGFESASNLAEETNEPTKVVPRAMWRAVAVSGGIGLLFLVALTIAMPNVKAISANPAPVAAIMSAQLGTVVEKVFLVFVVVSIFACGMVIMITGSRLVFAMSRDRRFPGYQLFGRVSDKLHTPIYSTLLIFVGGVVIILAVGGTSSTLANLFTASTILPALIYLATVILYVATRHKLPRDIPGRFSLGRWEWPVVVLSLAWLTLELIVLIGPSEFWTPVKIVGILLGAGVVMFAGFLLFGRDALRREVGAATVHVEAEVRVPAS